MSKFRALSNIVRTCAREILYRLRLWEPVLSPDLTRSVEKFVSANQSHWPEMKSGDVRILVEGHLSQYGPNYAFRTAVAARALAEKLRCRAAVVFNGFSYQWTAARSLYRSFGICEGIYLGTAAFPLDLAFYCYSRLAAAWCKRGLKSPDDILRISLSGIRVGDLIYDDLIRGGTAKTVETLDSRVTRAIARNFHFYLKYRHIFRRHRYEYYVATHTSYSEYGMLCRVALMHGVKVVETTDIQMSYYDRISAEVLPTYHEGIRNSIVDVLRDDAIGREGRIAKGLAALQDRLDAKIDHVDVKNAFSGDVYSKSDLRKALGIGDGQPIVFVMAHVFSDAPHLSSWMLHTDYYQWLLSTLEIARKVTGVAWVVKPHPTRAVYGEEGLVEAMVQKLSAGNIHLCPSSLNGKSIAACADALVTVHGTAGLEFACHGVPVVLGGRPFYYGLGFTIEPQTLAGYESALRELAAASPLTNEQLDRALEIYAIWEGLFDWSNPVITLDVVASVWGSGRPRDLEESYEIIAKNMLSVDPRKLKLWEFAQSVAK